MVGGVVVILAMMVVRKQICKEVREVLAVGGRGEGGVGDDGIQQFALTGGRFAAIKQLIKWLMMY